MTNLSKYFDAITSDENPSAILHKVTLLEDHEQQWCESLKEYGYAPCKNMFSFLDVNLSGDQRTRGAIRLIVSTLGAILFFRRNIDCHPLAFPAGTFSLEDDLSSELAEFCMDITTWNEVQIQIASILLRSAQPIEQGRPTEAPESVEKNLLGFRLRAQTSINLECKWCITAATCIVAWWWTEVKITPPWIPIWISRLKALSPHDYQCFRSRPQVQRQLRAINYPE